MFCDEHDPSELEHRPLKRYEIPASKLVLELGYSVDYEAEKENFEPDEADTVELINGERMPWEQAKRDGIDYIALYLSLIHISSLLLSPLFLFIGILVFCLPMPDNMIRKDTKNAARRK